MDKIINILLLIIIFVFDPLAIALVVAANFAFDQIQVKNNIDLYDEYFQRRNEMVTKYTKAASQSKKQDQWNEERMNIIGQNGNDGIHYDLKEEVTNEVSEEETLDDEVETKTSDPEPKKEDIYKEKSKQPRPTTSKGYWF